MSEQAKQQTTPAPKPPKQLKSASQRQTDYVARLKAKGYVQLYGIFVPALARDEIREGVKKLVADWETKNVPEL